jgi:hypothetical protein
MHIRLQSHDRGQDNSSMENMLTPVLNADLMADSHEAVDAIKTAAGLTDAQFAALCMPVLRAYADHVQRLPLTAAAFGSPKGAWEFGLTAAMVAYRYAGTVIFFPTLGAEERRMLEPQCRYMAFLATLSTAVATVAESSVLVAGEDEYHPLSVETTLYAWLTEHPSPRFSWRVPAAPLSAQAGAAIAANFVPKRLLVNFDLRTVLMMYEAINPKTTMNGVESTLARVVRQAVQGVLEHYKSKQAGTFQPDANATGVSHAEADKVASKLIALANPTILANPLEAPATPRVAATPTNAAPATQTPNSTQAVPVEAPDTTAVPYQPALAPAAAAHQTEPLLPTSSTSNEAEEKLSRGHKVLREWFSALKQHEKFSVLKDQLVMNEAGIEVPVSMLGMFGVSGATIRKMMDDAGLVLGRSPNARGVILHPGLRDRFITQ